MPAIFGDQPALVRTVIEDQFGVIAGPVIMSILVVLSATMTTADGFVIFAGESLEVTVARDGTFSLALPPNTDGTHYTATYTTPNGMVVERWVVPASATPVKLKDVRVN